MRPSNVAQFLEIAFQEGHPILLKGMPGICKTAIVKQVAERLGYELIIDHPVVSDPIDYKGFPKMTKDGAEFVPFGNLKRICMATKPTIYFLDDLGQAPPAVQAACMQLLLARHVGEHHVSNHVTFVAATNRKSDMAGVTHLLEPVKSRFVSILEVEPSLDDWMGWFYTTSYDPMIAAFVKWRPEFISSFKATADIVNSPCPRTIEHVAKLEQAFKKASVATVDNPMFMEAVAGAAGEGFAIEYTNFLKVASRLPDPDKILKNPETVEFDTSEPDIVYAVIGSILPKITTKNMGNVVKLANRLQSDWAVVLMRMVAQKDNKLCECTAFVGWAQANVEVMTGAV